MISTSKCKRRQGKGRRRVERVQPWSIRAVLRISGELNAEMQNAIQIKSLRMKSDKRDPLQACGRCNKLGHNDATVNERTLLGNGNDPLNTNSPEGKIDQQSGINQELTISHQMLRKGSVACCPRHRHRIVTIPALHPNENIDIQI